MKEKRILTGVLVLVVVLGLFAGCGRRDKKDNDVIKIGLTGTIYEDIWNPIIKDLKKEGINIELVQFSDFSLPNEALDSGDIDLNAFQHHAYFNNDVESNGYQITPIGDTFVIAMNIYSNKIKDVSALKAGDKVAIPNDASNGGRALKVLESAGIITLKEGAGSNPEIADIEAYNVKIEIVEVGAADICTLLPDVTAAVINGNYALDYGIDPSKDAIFEESMYDDDSYFCLIAARTDEVDKEEYQKIVKAFQSEKTKQIFQDEFKGFFVPAWEK